MTDLHDVNLDPLPPEGGKMELEGGEEGGLRGVSRKKKIIILSSLLAAATAALLAIVISLAVLIPKRSEPTNTSTPASSSNGPAAFNGQFTGKRSTDIERIAASLSGPSVQQGGTPANSALYWIIDDDPMKLNASDAYLIQRYVAAVIFFSTDGLQWSNYTNFLNGNSECTWDGITCNSTNGRVQKLVFGE